MTTIEQACLFDICQGCGAEFTRIRRDQKYCVKSCGKATRSKEWKVENRERYNQYQRAWKEKHPDKAYLAAARVDRKVCTKCGESKPLSSFEFRYELGRQPDARKSQCRKCRKGPWHKQRRQIIDDYWKSHPCVDCGEADLDVLEFDHRDPFLKHTMVPRASSLKVLLAEIEKCDVRCANCHRRRHARERRASAVPKA